MRLLTICGSTRKGRQTPKVAEYIHKRLKSSPLIEAVYLDLKHADLPFMEERLVYLENPPQSVLQFSRMVNDADTLLIVTPEYNGGFPGVLKSALDFLTHEYKEKRAYIATVSAGGGGQKSYESLFIQLSRLDAVVATKLLHITNVTETFNEKGEITDPETRDKTHKFIEAILP